MVNATADMMLELGQENAVTPEMLSNITNHVLITVGNQDHMVSQDESQASAKALKHGRFHLFEGFKHPLEKNPPEMLTEKMIEFFCA